MNETEVSLKVDVICNIFWKGTAVSISSYKRNFLLELLYSKDNLVDQIKKIEEQFWACFLTYMSSCDDQIYF